MTKVIVGVGGIGFPVYESAKPTQLLSCYDRIIVTGALPGACYAGGMTSFLYAHGIRIFDYPTSSGLKISGSLRGRWTGFILAIASGRSRVTPKKNFNSQIAAFSDAGEVPWSTRCNW